MDDERKLCWQMKSKSLFFVKNKLIYPSRFFFRFLYLWCYNIMYTISEISFLRQAYTGTVTHLITLVSWHKNVRKKWTRYFSFPYLFF